MTRTTWMALSMMGVLSVPAWAGDDEFKVAADRAEAAAVRAEKAAIRAEDAAVKVDEATARLERIIDEFEQQQERKHRGRR